LDTTLFDTLWPHREPVTWLVIATAVAAGGMLRGITGFGAALMMAPLLSRVVTAQETLCLVTVLNALPLTNALSAPVRRLVDHRLLLPMAGAACAGIVPGLWLVSVVPAQMFGQVVGAAVIVSALSLLLGFRLVRQRSTPMSLGVGVFSGVLTGFGGVGGPPAILYVMGIERDGHRARASFLVYFGCIYPVALLGVAVSGLLSVSLLLQGLVLAPLFHYAGRVGEVLFRRLSVRVFRPLVLVLLVLAGAMAAWPAGVDSRHTGAPASVVQGHLCSAAVAAPMCGTPDVEASVFHIKQ
jgi:uncharacterized protein